MFRVVTYACFIYVWDQHNLHCRENFTKFVNVLFVLAWKAQYVSVAAGATALVSLLLGEQVELLDIDIGTHTCVSCWCINESETAEFKCFNRGLKAIWEWMLSTGFNLRSKSLFFFLSLIVDSYHSHSAWKWCAPSAKKWAQQEKSCAPSETPDLRGVNTRPKVDSFSAQPKPKIVLSSWQFRDYSISTVENFRVGPPFSASWAAAKPHAWDSSRQTPGPTHHPRAIRTPRWEMLNAPNANPLVGPAEPGPHHHVEVERADVTSVSVTVNSVSFLRLPLHWHLCLRPPPRDAVKNAASCRTRAAVCAGAERGEWGAGPTGTFCPHRSARSRSRRGTWRDVMIYDLTLIKKKIAWYIKK